MLEKKLNPEESLFVLEHLDLLIKRFEVKKKITIDTKCREYIEEMLLDMAFPDGVKSKNLN